MSPRIVHHVRPPHEGVPFCRSPPHGLADNRLVVQSPLRQHRQDSIDHLRVSHLLDRDQVIPLEPVGNQRKLGVVAAASREDADIEGSQSEGSRVANRVQYWSRAAIVAWCVRVLAYLRRPFSSEVVGQYEEVLQIDYAVEVQISDNGVNRQRTNQHHQGDSSD